MVWFGLGWFCAFANPITNFVFSFGIFVWELHVVAPEGVGLRLVWLGSWLVSLGFLNNNKVS